MSQALNTSDYLNLLKIVSRGTYSGLQEAEIAVALKNKLHALVRESNSADAGKNEPTE